MALEISRRTSGALTCRIEQGLHSEYLEFGDGEGHPIFHRQKEIKRVGLQHGELVLPPMLLESTKLAEPSTSKRPLL